MTTTELDETSQAILRVIGEIEARHQAPTVQAAAIGARASYMDAYAIVNRLFTEGLLTHDMRLTDAGRKAIG